MDLNHVIARDKSVLDVKSFLRVNPDVEITETHLLMACKLNNGAMFPVLMEHGGKPSEVHLNTARSIPNRNIERQCEIALGL